MGIILVNVQKLNDFTRMGFFKQLFRAANNKKPETLSDRVRQEGGRIIVSRFRQIAAANNCAPTAKTSDEKILEIYQRVGTAFRQEAENRGSIIPAGNLNAIVFQFIQVYELVGEEKFSEHLKYEIARFHDEGLRQDYLAREINLF